VGSRRRWPPCTAARRRSALQPQRARWLRLLRWRRRRLLLLLLLLLRRRRRLVLKFTAAAAGGGPRAEGGVGATGGQTQWC
jgi:hypothetical protein